MCQGLAKPLRYLFATLFVVKHEAAINRGTRLFTFQPARNTNGDWCAPASVVAPPPGGAAVSTLLWDDTHRKFRCRWLGHFGVRYMATIDAYTPPHPPTADIALVIAIDCDGTVLYSREL